MRLFSFASALSGWVCGTDPFPPTIRAALQMGTGVGAAPHWRQEPPGPLRGLGCHLPGGGDAGIPCSNMCRLQWGRPSCTVSVGLRLGGCSPMVTQSSLQLGWRSALGEVRGIQRCSCRRRAPGKVTESVMSHVHKLWRVLKTVLCLTHDVSREYEGPLGKALLQPALPTTLFNPQDTSCCSFSPQATGFIPTMTYLWLPQTLWLASDIDHQSPT